MTNVSKRFIVKHYVSNEHPTLKGAFTEIDVAEDRETAQEFADDLNSLLQYHETVEGQRLAFLYELRNDVQAKMMSLNFSPERRGLEDTLSYLDGQIRAVEKGICRGNPT